MDLMQKKLFERYQNHKQDEIKNKDILKQNKENLKSVKYFLENDRNNIINYMVENKLNVIIIENIKYQIKELTRDIKITDTMLLNTLRSYIIENDLSDDFSNFLSNIWDSTNNCKVIFNKTGNITYPNGFKKDTFYDLVEIEEK